MYFTFEDIKLYYEKYGESEKNIVILPGWGDTRHTFTTMINFLKDYFTVYILDWPGFSNSNFPNRDLTIYHYADLVHEFLESLELTDPILIGHSFGGRIIITLLGYYHYSYSNIILMNSAGVKPKRTLIKKFRTFSYKIFKKTGKILPKKRQKAFYQKLFSKYASTDYKCLKDNMRKTFQNIVNEDLTPYLQYINTKTLLIWGSCDDATPIKDAYKMKRLIKESELVTIKGATHFAYLEKPYLINSIIYEQLKDEIS